MGVAKTTPLSGWALLSRRLVGLRGGPPAVLAPPSAERVRCFLLENAERQRVRGRRGCVGGRWSVVGAVGAGRCAGFAVRGLVVQGATRLVDLGGS